MAGGDLGNKLSRVNDIKLIYRYCKIVLRKKLPRYCLKKKIDIDENTGNDAKQACRIEGATKEFFNFK